jgi:hypothetical protein
VTHARLWSRGRVQPDVDALAARGGEIIATGRTSDVLASRGPATRVIDAGGATLTPGFTDAHVHLLHWARARTELDLDGCTSREDVAARLARFLLTHPGSSAVVGRGWDANGWSGRPERAALDPASGTRPVLLYSRDFHNLWLNSAALVAAGITSATPDPPGGAIARDATGEPTGLLGENATRLAGALETADHDADFTAVCDAVRALYALGVTGIHDFEGADAHRILRRLAGSEGPRVRTLMHLPHAQLGMAIELGLASGLGDAWFRLGAVKLFADGTLGSRTAALLAPYDGTLETGLDVIDPVKLRAEVLRAVDHGWSVAIHAIGDRAVRASLDAFGAARAGKRLGLAPRIEHAQLVDPADLHRFVELGVAASMQPSHCISDAPLADRWWGSRREQAYPWRALSDSGALLAFGSDAPVEPPAVALGLAAAVARHPADAPHAWVPAQAIGLDAALTAYTEGPARLAGNWPRVGALDPGCVADLVVWNLDLHALAPRRLADAAATCTVLDGKVVFESAAGAPMLVAPLALAGRVAGEKP